jgi:hypothetical protein
VVDYVEIDKYAVDSYNAIYGTNFEPQDITQWDKDVEVDLIVHGSPCFVKGTKILTDQGYKNIEDIKIGDSVLTHKNRFRAVTDVGHNENKPIIKLKAQGIYDTYVTENHPYYVRTVHRVWNNNKRSYDRVFSEPYWKEVKKLTKQDFIGANISAIESNLYELNKVKKQNKSYIDLDNNIVWYPIKQIEKTDRVETVYNMTVDEDNSYTANNAIVHNCTNFSLAGKQEGGDEGTGTASSLMWETLRIITKLKPRYVIWENVASVTSKMHKHNFYKYIEIMNTLGYTNAYKILNSKDFGVPQDRKRLFVVSILGNSEFVFPIEQTLKISYKDCLENDYDIEKYVLKEKHLKAVKGTEQYAVDYNFRWKSSRRGYIPYYNTQLWES